jgi:hypothetical protein
MLTDMASGLGSLFGQNAKTSTRADVFRPSANYGHSLTGRSAQLKST